MSVAGVGEGLRSNSGEAPASPPPIPIRRSCAATSRRTGAVMLATTVGASARQALAEVACARSASSTPLASALAVAASIAGGLVVVAAHRVPAELGGGDREDAGAGAEVGERPVRLAGLLQLEQ